MKFFEEQVSQNKFARLSGSLANYFYYPDCPSLWGGAEESRVKVYSEILPPGPVPSPERDRDLSAQALVPPRGGQGFAQDDRGIKLGELSERTTKDA
jgi:hypothetical protein